MVGVVTGDDVPDGRMGAFIKDEHALAKGKVLYVGEPVAAIAAETLAEARSAVNLINVEYEELPAVLSPEEGLVEDAPILHEELESYIKVFDTGSEGNLCSRTELSEGDVDAAWAIARSSSRMNLPPSHRHMFQWNPAVHWQTSTRRAASPCGLPISPFSGCRLMFAKA